MEASVSVPAPVVAEAAAEKVENSAHVGVPAATETAAVPRAPPFSVGVKKKRGRPRKYRPDGSLLRPLNPMPISASVPARSFYVSSAPAMKRGRGRPAEFISMSQHRIELEPSGLKVACSAGANFTPHIINVAAGEDVTMKIISFSQQGPRATCILSANGVISNVTLRQPDASGGTLTYEGRFELLSLSGSFMPNENEGTKSRSGGMSVSLASPDGRVVGGGIAGLLVAASPVQVVVGSFLPSYQMEQKTKRPKSETVSLSVSIPAAVLPMSGIETDEVYGGGYLSSTTPKSTPTASGFRVENWSSCSHSAPDNKNYDDTKVSLP